MQPMPYPNAEHRNAHHAKAGTEFIAYRSFPSHIIYVNYQSIINSRPSARVQQPASLQKRGERSAEAAQKPGQPVLFQILHIRADGKQLLKILLDVRDA